MEFGTVRGIVVVSGVSKRVYMPSAGTGRRLFCAESKVSEGMSVLEKSEEKERQAKRVLVRVSRLVNWIVVTLPFRSICLAFVRRGRGSASERSTMIGKYLFLDRPSREDAQVCSRRLVNVGP